jgi:hypothetical protein
MEMKPLDKGKLLGKPPLMKAMIKATSIINDVLLRRPLIFTAVHIHAWILYLCN